MAETNPKPTADAKPHSQPRSGAEDGGEAVPVDKLATVLERFLAQQEAQSQASKPAVPTADLFESKIPNGVFKVPNHVGSGFTLRNCHGDEVDAKGKILNKSEVEGVRALADD